MFEIFENKICFYFALISNQVTDNSVTCLEPDSKPGHLSAVRDINIFTIRLVTMGLFIKKMELGSRRYMTYTVNMLKK